MKICLISNLYPPYILGGTERYIQQIANYLDNEVFVISTKPFDGISSLGGEILHWKVPVYRFFPANIYHTYNAKEKVTLIKPLWHLIDLWNCHSYLMVKKILRKEMPDVVHTHNLGGLSLSIFSAIKSLKIPLIHTLHDYALICPNAMLFRSTKKICKAPSALCKMYSRLKKNIAKPNVVIAPSEFILNEFLSKGFFPGTSYVKLRFGFEIPRDRIVKEYETIDVLYVGQLSPHKGVDILIKAFQEITAEHIRLHIVGKGQDFRRYQRVAEKDPRILFHGFVPTQKLRQIYECSNISVIPSIWYENSPVFIYESFIYQNPVIGSRIGGIPELIKDDYNGYMFEPGDSDKLKRLLDTLIEDRIFLERLSKGARETAREYDIKEHVSKLKKIYEAVIDET
jgi:glycosyltransferase involved in cell wall biosynthesis